MFEFEYPTFFVGLVLPLIWILIFIIWHRKNQKRLYIWNPLEFPESKSVPFSLSRKNYAFLMAMVACIIALANPRIGSGLEETKVERSDIYIALDISQSMNARDISPSRLEKAKRWTESLIQSVKGNRIGLVFFAGNAYLQMPLSVDYATALMYCKSAQTELAPTQGSSIADAMDLVLTIHQNETKSQKTLVIVSDGEEHENEAQKAAEKLFAQDWLIFTVGVGTEAGSEIPVLLDGMEDLAREEDGSLAISKLHWNTLQSIAERGGGKAFDIRDGNNAIKQIQANMLTARKEMSEVKSFRQYTSFFPLCIALAILLFLISFDVFPKLIRRTTLWSTFLCLAVFPVFGQQAHTLLKNGDQLYENEKFMESARQYSEAAKKEPSFSSYYNLGNSLYQLQKYSEAQQAYQKALELAETSERISKTYHNLGNALFQQKQYRQSVDAYKKALQQNPGDKETIENLLKARKLAKEQEQQNQQNQNKDKNQDGQSQNSPNDPEDKQQNQNQENQKPTPDSNENNDKDTQAPLTREEAEKLLEIIENEDKKVNKKIRRGSSRPSKPSKPW